MALEIDLGPFKPPPIKLMPEGAFDVKKPRVDGRVILLWSVVGLGIYFILKRK